MDFLALHLTTKTKLPYTMGDNELVKEGSRCKVEYHSTTSGIVSEGSLAWPFIALLRKAGQVVCNAGSKTPVVVAINAELR